MKDGDGERGLRRRGRRQDGLGRNGFDGELASLDGGNERASCEPIEARRSIEADCWIPARTINEMEDSCTDKE